MKKLKTIDSDSLLSKQLKNKDFKNEYDKLEKEFEIAAEIIQLRKQAKLSQSELASKAHTSQSAISRAEAGNYKNMSLSLLKKIGRALDAVPEIHFKKV